jgi:hypothetical protein
MFLFKSDSPLIRRMSVPPVRTARRSNASLHRDASPMPGIVRLSRQILRIAVKRNYTGLLQHFQARNGGKDFHPFIDGQTKAAADLGAPHGMQQHHAMFLRSREREKVAAGR